MHGWTGWLLAPPLFCTHVHTLNTSEVVSWAVSKNDCRSSCSKFHWQKGNIALGFIAISVYLMAISYCDRKLGRSLGARLLRPLAACSWCAQLSLYAESEITSFVPQAPSSLTSAIRSASDGKLGVSLGARLLIQYSTWIRILLAYIYMITTKKRSLSKCFAAGACLHM